MVVNTQSRCAWNKEEIFERWQGATFWVYVALIGSLLISVGIVNIVFAKMERKISDYRTNQKYKKFRKIQTIL